MIAVVKISRARLQVFPDRLNRRQAKAVRAVSRKLRPFLKKQGKKVAQEIGRAYHVKFKASSGDQADAQRILESLDLSDWVAIGEQIRGQLELGFDQGGSDALITLNFDDKEMFNRVNDRAVAFALDRAAELVGKKYVDGVLADNPDAQWAITESTRQGLRDLVVKALTDGMSVDELEQSIVDSYWFSEARAEMISRTELAFAHVSGSIAGWQESDVVKGYAWILGSEHAIEDECDDNDGVEVKLGELFPSGDPGPPAHPNCVCGLEPILKPEYTADE